ncbi:hypothetical protein FHP29_11970 [Nocardioides albidus]|uniref:Uncharacterized protein n=1 Tax=Nocardioides albidus TaxID=1517589 RepID=A0A5C4VUL2_9ACTN|nr:hypothetical protein [Nocardioides albidus]TNM39590.1 hypothetical protein FHP29_11970 [Nocardioides albidus]
MISMLRTCAPLVLALTSTVAALAACGNAVDADVIGTTAVTVGADGRPVAVVRVCTGGIDTLQLLGDRTGLADDEPNPVLGTWRAATERDGTVELVLGSADDGWRGPEEIALEDDSTYVLSASDSDQDAEATQVSFTPAQLASLAPDQVVVRDGEVVARADLDDCAG